MKNKYFLNKKSGFTLIEMLFFLFIFVTVSLTFYKTLTVGTQVMLESKNRLSALALANQKMEIVRNLQYDDVGTTSGIPTGTLFASEDVTASSRTFHVNTFVQYMDDPLDGSYPDDPIPNDYKRVKIAISWKSFSGTDREVSVISRFVPPGLEVSSGDGILSINVIDGTGAGVPQADVQIVNNSVSPHINISQETSDNGNLMFPGASESIQKYAITVSKSGYESVTTIDPASVSYSHTDVHASVVKGLLNTKSITIDLLADLTIKSVDQLGAAIPDVSFHLEGGRNLGTDTSVVPAETVYLVNSDETTDSSGEKKMLEQGPGQFFITNIESVSGYALVGVSPITLFDSTIPSYKASLLPGEEKSVEIKFAKEDEPGLIVQVKNDSDSALINGAEVKLTNTDGYSQTVVTSLDGVAFFPNNSTALVNGEYALEVVSSGSQTYSGTVEVNNLTNQEVKLIAS
jgi:type II secretory pathway pseudopilin PulG